MAAQAGRFMRPGLGALRHRRLDRQMMRRHAPRQPRASQSSRGNFSAAGRAVSAMCARRQAGHQQPASMPGTGTTGGKAVHQQGPSAASAMAQPKAAPQRVHRLMAQPCDRNYSSCVIS
jgi:hypothetical protein